MMPLIENKKIKQTLLASALLFIMPLAQAWVTPVNMDIDHEGDGTTFHRLSKIVDGVTVYLDRCDTDSGIYATAPTQCHRRNLVWQLGSKNESDVAVPLAQWNPELGDDSDWRLPTIKELARLVDYSGITAAGGALTGQPLILNMFSDAIGFEVNNAWLISSTHRDIDGVDTNNQAQIFGVNMGNGAIAAFDTVSSEVDNGEVTAVTVDHTDPTSVEVGDVITVSDETTAGTQTIVTINVGVIVSTDDVNEVIVVDGVQATQTITLEKCTGLDDAADTYGECFTTDVYVYALLVNVETVTQLATP